MNAYLRVIAAETLKLKGTLALRMCAVAPLVVVVGLLTLQLLFMRIGNIDAKTPAEAWSGYVNGVFGLWNFLMLPLFVTLQAALLTGLEHGDKHWKHLLALPVPRSAHYLAKAAALVAMLVLALLVLCLVIPVGGWALMELRPVLGIAGTPPMLEIAQRALPVLPAALGMIALQLWISVRWSSFTVAVAVGMVATVMGYLIGQSDRFGPWYPWSMPLWTMAKDGAFVPQVLAASTALCLITLAFGLWDFRRRDAL
jgi:lantibiotic transport system permease protein